MGLLDDAIREHLELKRSHGADPSDIARQEHEALGPVRRTAEPAEPAHSEDVEPHGEAGGDAYADGDFGGVDEAWGDRFGQDEASAAVEDRQVLEPEPAPQYHDEPPYDDAPQAASGAIEVDEPLPPDPRLSQPTTELSADELHEALHGAPPAAESEAPSEPERASEPAQAPEPREGDEPAHEADKSARDADEPAHEADKPAREADKPAGDAAKSGKEAEDVLEETPDFLQETPEHDRLWFEQRPPRDFDF